MLVTLNSQESFYRHQSNSLTSFSQQDPRGSEANAESKAGNVLQQVLNEKISGVSSSESKDLNPGAFSPEKVAERISNFVSQGLEKARQEGKSEAEIQKLYDDAVAGVKKGFDEARDILEEMNLLTDDISETINTTFDQTLDALNAINPAADTSERFPVSSSMFAAERYSKSESFSLDLKTQDGDTVTIDFSNSNDYQASFGAYNDGEGNSAAAFSIDRSQSSNYQFVVKGDLDEDELEAIENLIQDVSLIADDFFDGDVQAAFQQATEFQMDKTELASMSLTLTRSEQYSVAAAYQQVQGLGESQNPGRKLGHMMHDLANQFGNPALDFLDSPFSFGQDLLDSLIPQDTRYQEADENKQSLYDQSLQQMQNILSSLSGNHNQDDS
ncbi:DUF5610 domain-containing protein [Motiliproteus sp. MSK22-1]|uniref:DUF5610 domain-containing protein n=1 Tax=Motiliproteus sp. MSK22-1 TaxID=1897630 RepID=UPI000976DDA1|nr:DUF5610 domain-containing protein [Motiliproteus sp. MSK22-1]OMH39714.1 hypothetical protein BGP75_01235 [Motiliproteus sp. MSK22-1]